MSEWTCDQVQGRIDLFAAGEADGATRDAIGRHIQACAACGESLRKATELMGMLDQRFQEREGLERLWSRLEIERRRDHAIGRGELAEGSRRSPGVRLRWVTAALAASVLLLIGLSSWQGPATPGAPAGLPLDAVAIPRAMRNGAEIMMAPAKAIDPAANFTEPAVPVYSLDLGGKSPAQFRRDVRATATGRLPPPPAVERTLEVRNTGRDVLALRLGDEKAELILDLQGPGVLDVQAPGGAPPLDGLGMVDIKAGGKVDVPVQRLVGGTHGAVHYLYWTAPGEYTLWITLRAPLQGDPLGGTRQVTASAGPIKLRVVAAP